MRPLSTERSTTTLRLHHLMEEQQRLEIGERIKELRNASPQTNRSIADYVGVGERAVANWIAGGGIAWDNAKRVADLFAVDVQWLWSGREQGPAPDPFSNPELARLSEAVAELGVELAATKNELLAEIGKVRTAQAAPRSRRASGGQSRATKSS